MSVEAMTWALKQPVEHSSAKFVLVVLANCASAASNLAYPSVAYLADATGQNRKTVLANLARLSDDGYIADSGERRGKTGQIVVYRLRIEVQGDGDLLTERHYCYRSDDPSTGRFYIGVRTCLGEPIADAAYIGSGRWVQTLAASGVQPIKTVLSVFASRVRAEEAERELIAASIADPLCMNRAVPAKRPENGTLPNEPENGTVPAGERVPKSARKSPKNGTRNRQNQKLSVEADASTSSARGKRLPIDWQPSDALRAWVAAEYPLINLPGVVDEFRDHWCAVPGARGTKLDWDMTFRNRVRALAARQPRNHHASAPRESAAERVARRNAEAELRRRGGDDIDGEFQVVG